MGFVRINIPNPHGVYMHDTPAKGIFGDDFRFVRSRLRALCARNVREYVSWILQGHPERQPDTIEAIIQGGQRVDAKPLAPIPVYWTYITAWSTPDGLAVPRRHLQARRRRRPDRPRWPPPPPARALQPRRPPTTTGPTDRRSTV